MGRNPLAIVREYRSASEPAVRSKAVQALGVVAELPPCEDAVEDLVNTALYDSDDQVRREAERVVRKRLGLNQRAAAIEVLDRRVDNVLHKDWRDAEREDLLEEMVANRLVQQRALALLVKLRNQHIEVEWTQRSFRDQLDLAVSSRTRPPLPKLRVVVRTLIAAAGSSILGTVVLVVALVGFKIPVSISALLILAFTGFVLATLFAGAAPWRTTTTRSYLDRTAGAVVEIFGTMANSLLPAAALVVIVMLVWLQDSQASATEIALLVLVAMVGIQIYIGAIRLGDMLCAAAFPKRPFFRERLPRSAIGWASGTAFLSLLFLGLRWPEGAAADESVTFAAGIGLLLLPAGISVAWTVSLMPPEKPAVSPSFRRYAAGAVVVLLVAIPFLLVWIYYHPYRTAPSAPEGIPFHAPQTEEWSHARVPASERFSVRFTQKIDSRIVPESERSPVEFALRLYREGEANLLIHAVAPPSIEGQVLEPGAYVLEANVRGRQRPATRFSNELFAVARLLARLDSPDRPDLVPGQTVAPYRIELKLNADPEFAMITRVQQSLAAGRIEEAVGVLRRAENLLDGFEPSLDLLDQTCRLSALRGLLNRTAATGRSAPRRPSNAPLTVTEDALHKFCDAAVERSADNPAANDSRALARILTGDRRGAIEDLERFITWYGEAEASERRRQWIQRLRTDRPPGQFFAVGELARLLAETDTRTLHGVAESSFAARTDHLTNRLQQGTFDHIVEELDRLQARKPFFDRWGVWHSLCLYAAPRDAMAALEPCRRALENRGLEAGDRAVLLESRALALLRFERLDEARGDLLKAVAAVSENDASPQVLQWLAKLERGESPLEEPEIEEFLQASRLLPLALKASILG